MKFSQTPRPPGRATVRRAQPLPRISKVLLKLFGRYADGFVRRHFHSVRLLRRAFPAVPVGLPVVIYLNHASWWDPLVCLLLARRFFRKRHSFGPIESTALQRYRFFRRLGFFGIESGTRLGATQFLETAQAILTANGSALWLTPQGEFVDQRARPLHFQRGLAHLATSVERAAFVPLAIEYSFWEERLPEILLGFGAPLIFDGQQHLSVPETTQLFETALTSVQDQVAAASQRRQPDEWDNILHGRAGSNPVYDLWRRGRARSRGEKFSSAHSGL